MRWRCFHCEFVTSDRKDAALHFGRFSSQQAICTVPPEAYRQMEAEIRRYREEDTALHRAMFAMQVRHRTELIREEEKGYYRGLSDGAKERATIPGFKWCCAMCEFSTEDMHAAMMHTEDTDSMDHWLFEHPNGDRTVPPARSMHGSDQGFPPYVDLQKPGFTELWRK